MSVVLLHRPTNWRQSCDGDDRTQLGARMMAALHAAPHQPDGFVFEVDETFCDPLTGFPLQLLGEQPCFHGVPLVRSEG